MLDFEKKLYESLKETIQTKQKTAELCSAEIEKSAQMLADTLRNGGKILICGNGGSAADSQHIAAELVVRLRSHINRPALAAIALTVDSSILTAGGNDIGFDNIFARQVEALARPGDILIAISTSGNSENVLRAAQIARKMGVRTIGLLGKDGGKIKNECDLSVIVPSANTARIQETHIFIAHLWCEAIEELLFPEFFQT
ncbi:MAG TPA: D-sedoheptulose 7-phosphate isomerase [Candidatus Kapabacteria bacterium]|nr:D-sedoheptulose 7-phosphate isomerase [Candidatus Kapabacteria bacterium]HPP39016.1 D-sedoheptulose 7-phosphate isomerase [Candidatus Kapabacteria bacterium]